MIQKNKQDFPKSNKWMMKEIASKSLGSKISLNKINRYLYFKQNLDILLTIFNLADIF